MLEGLNPEKNQSDDIDRHRILEVLRTAVDQLQREIATRKDRTPDDSEALLAELDGLRQLRNRAGIVEHDPDIFVVLASHVKQLMPYSVISDDLSALSRMVETDISANSTANPDDERNYHLSSS